MTPERWEELRQWPKGFAPNTGALLIPELVAEVERLRAEVLDLREELRVAAEKGDCG